MKCILPALSMALIGACLSTPVLGLDTHSGSYQQDNQGVVQLARWGGPPDCHLHDESFRGFDCEDLYTYRMNERCGSVEGVGRSSVFGPPSEYSGTDFAEMGRLSAEIESVRDISSRSLSQINELFREYRENIEEALEEMAHSTDTLEENRAYARERGMDEMMANAVEADRSFQQQQQHIVDTQKARALSEVPDVLRNTRAEPRPPEDIGHEQAYLNACRDFWEYDRGRSRRW